MKRQCQCLTISHVPKPLSADPLDLFITWNCMPTRDPSHDTAQRIHLSVQYPFSNAPDRWITRELPDCDQVLRDQ